MITEQAQIIAYIDDYKLLMIATLAVIPLLLVFRKASAGERKFSRVGTRYASIIPGTDHRPPCPSRYRPPTLW